MKDLTKDEMEAVSHALQSISWRSLVDAGVVNDHDEAERQFELAMGVLDCLQADLARMYDREYGDDRECECGHPYYRHFDTYDGMAPVGCKYCQCHTFTESPRA